MDFDQIVAKNLGERYQAHLGLLLEGYIFPHVIPMNTIVRDALMLA